MDKAKDIKIAYIVPKNYSKFTESRIYKQANSLKKRGYKVKIFSLRISKLPVFEIDNGIEIYRFRFFLVERIPFLIRKILFLIPFWTPFVLIRLFRFKPQVLHCSNLPSIHIAWIYSWFYHVKIISDSHELFVEQNFMNNRSRFFKTLIKKWEKFLSHKVDVLFQTSDARANLFEKYYGIKPLTILNKPLPPVEIENPIELINELKRKEIKIIGYVGRVAPYRGIEQVIEIVSNYKDVAFVLIGNADSPWAKKLLKKYENIIYWIPPVSADKITSVISSFDIGVSLIQNSCLSYYLEIPTKTFEFIAAGVPQITSDFPEIRKVILENKYGPVGKVANPAENSEIKKSIEEMIKNKDLEIQYRKNCSLLKKDCFWESEEEKLYKVYDSLLNN